MSYIPYLTFDQLFGSSQAVSGRLRATTPDTLLDSDNLIHCYWQ